MTEGYCVEDGREYFCSDECLFVDGYTPELRDIDYENGSIYYTIWERVVMKNTNYDLNDMIDEIAEKRTEDAEVSELERMYYDIQYASLEDMTEEDVLQIYKDMGLYNEED